MADEIIDFYKKAKEPEEPQKPIEEQKETPVPVIPNPDEPFDRFLLELAEKLQKEKVITEKQQETFVEQIKEPVSTDPNENDPFKKFIGSFANILKEDELVNREENIKEATISFINKLKEQPDEPFIIKDEQIVKTKKQKYLPPKIAKRVQKLPQPVKKEEPVVEEQADEPVKEEPKDENSYVKELKTADKTNKKIPEKIKNVSDIKSIVEKQVAEILSRYPNLGFTGGGGGTNAVQYAKGGTMDGDLNVTGKFLSGGVDISTLFSTGGGIVSGIPDRLISGSQSLILNTDGSISFPDGFVTAPDGQILNIQSETASPSSFARISLSPYAFFAYDNEGNSISFDVVDNAIVLTSKDQYEWIFNQQGVLVGPNGHLTVNALSSLGRILSGGKDLTEIFLTSASDAQTLSWIPSSYLLSISNGNSVSLASLSSAGGGTGRDDVNTIVISNSANWNTAYNVATAYQALSGDFVTSTVLNSVSSLLLPTTIYQQTSSNWQDTYTTVQNNSANWNETYQTAITSVNNFTGKDVTLNNYIYTTVSQNVSSNRKYGFNTINTTLTATLPSNPQIGDEIEFFDIHGTWFINPFIIENNNNYIEQRNDNLFCNVRFGLFKLIFTGGAVGWRIIPLPKHDIPAFVLPFVSISSTIDLGYDPITVGFIGVNNLDPALGPVDNWYWNLTGGSQPDFFTQAVTYTYSTPGVYTVTLTASNIVGINTATKTITALPVLVPVPVISAASFTGATPFNITLSGINTLPVSASPVTNWYWNLTGGDDAQFTTQVTTFTYTSAGVYTVNLTASNMSGFGTATTTITATTPVVPLSTDPYSDYVTLLLHFNT